MTPEDIIELLEERLYVTVDGPDDDLIESGELDSLKFVELLLAVEEHANARISPSDLDLDDLRTPATIAKAFAEILTKGADE